MKQLTRAFSYKTLVTFLLLTLIQAVTWAQDAGSGGSGGGDKGGGSSTTTTSTSITQSDTWYTQPWVWVVGGAILLLIIIALTRGGGGSDTTGRSDKVTVTKSVRTDTDV